jgi:hypothetical protein
VIEYHPSAFLAPEVLVDIIHAHRLKADWFNGSGN